MDHRSLIRAATQTLIDHVDELTALDQRDRRRRPRPQHEARRAGDPGAADGLEGRSSLNETLKAPGMTCMSTIGGSSGPVFGTLLVTLAEGAARRSPGRADLAAALAAGIAALTRLGKAEVGQKTLLDVLDPVQRAARRQRPGSADLVARVRQCALDSAARHRGDGRDPRPRFLPRRARARPCRPRLALDGADHRRDLRRTELPDSTIAQDHRHEEADQPRRRRPRRIARRLRRRACRHRQPRRRAQVRAAAIARSPARWR